MLTLPLEPTDDRAHPVFKDAESCAQWLGQLQLTNVQLAHSLLLTQLNELNRHPMRGRERLDTLELLRETVGYVQDDFAKKLLAKPLPFNDNELMVFLAIVQLWQSMVVGYQRCLQAYMAGDKTLRTQGALLCQRCLLYTGAEIFEHLCSGYAVDSKLWHQLHQLYAYAEQQRLHEINVPDALGKHPVNGNCVNNYVKTLLACYARPAQLTRWQLQQLDSWLTLWSNNVTVKTHCKINKSDAQPLAIDLSGTQGLQQIANINQNNALRFLAMAPISKLLRVKTILLQQGQTPRQVGLGDHYDSQVCIEFLTFLHRCWCENSQKRLGDRRQIATHARLCYKFEGIYAHLAGKPFKTQGASDTLDRLAYSQIETLGYAPHTAQNNDLLEMGYPLENWQMKDESITGARLTRSDTIGGRLAYQQLIALRPGDAKNFMLGTTAWVNVTRQNTLQIGVSYLPGLPEPLLIRSAGINPADRTSCAPAFLLPHLPALKTPASLIIPRNWFAANRVIVLEPPDGKKMKVKLGFSVAHGLDYERVSFEQIPD